MRSSLGPPALFVQSRARRDHRSPPTRRPHRGARGAQEASTLRAHGSARGHDKALGCADAPSHGSQASTPAPAKPSCSAARARRGIAASHSRCLPHDACRCRHPPSARRTSFTLMRWCTVLYPATSDGATFEPVVQSACRTRTPHRCRDHGCFRVGHAWWWSRSEPVCIDDARVRKY